MIKIVKYQSDKPDPLRDIQCRLIKPLLFQETMLAVI